jgi:anti-sigma regulatory factor (Ser/Thr protein kinase)
MVVSNTTVCRENKQAKVQIASFYFFKNDVEHGHAKKQKL